MIAGLPEVAGPEVARDLRRNGAAIAVEAVVVGLGFILLVPALRHLFSGEVTEAWAMVGALALVTAFYGVMRFFSQVRGYKIGVNMAGVIFERLGRHIAQLPLGWFDVSQTGRLGRLTSQGVIEVITVPAHLMRPLIVGIFTPATVAICMAFFDWRLALTALAFAPIAYVTHRWAAANLQRADKAHDLAAVVAANRILEFAQAQSVMRAYGQLDRESTALDAALATERDAARSHVLTMGLGLSGFVIVIQVAFTAILLLGVSFALNGRIDAPELVALLVLTVRLVEPMFSSAEIGSVLRMATNSVAKMDALLSTPVLPEPKDPKPAEGDDIAFDQVSFAYAADRPVLSGVSFEAPARSMTAVVGPSGSGKTTLLRLIARFWDADGGAVRIGGVDVRERRAADLMAQLSIVFQDVYLLEGDIAENIRLGRPSASDAEVAEAARLAQVDEIAARLPGGLGAPVGEGGAILSGGERQRISIARAILKDAPIVLLDEATSALDPINEAAVQSGLQSLTRNKTLVVVAHRLHTIRTADQILFLERGVIAERGSHDDLVALGGRYAAFWDNRLRASQWRLGA
ncbi:MAG: ABC transporter ATP-binding protein [Pseudomonadota bacterium]